MILLLEDDPAIADTVAFALRREGFEVAHCAWLAEARERLQRGPAPALLILDIGLPDMEGTELAQRLRAQPHHEHVVMVALTGYGQASDRSRSLAAGFAYHLVKPVNYTDLSQLLRQVQPQHVAQPAANVS